MNVHTQPQLIAKWCKGRTVLDIGGIGNKDGAPHLLAIERAWTENATRVIVDCQEGANVRIDLDKTNLSATGTKADIVWIAHALPHLERPLHVLRDIKAVCETLIVVDGNAHSPVFRRMADQQRKRKGTFGHMYAWTMGDMECLLHRAGWRVVDRAWQCGGWWSLKGAASNILAHVWPTMFAYGYALRCVQSPTETRTPYAR